MDNKHVKALLDGLEGSDITFGKHFHEKTAERPISENLVREYLKRTDRLLKAEEQKARKNNEEKYKLWIKLSNKYVLIVIAVVSEKGLYIVTAWNADIKWQKLIKK